jgi:CheY-like chemotaxis protein
MKLIFLAEDDIDDQELLTDSLNEVNPSIQLICFSSGKKILKYLEELPAPDLPSMIILDYNIPEMNGAEILKQLEDRRYSQVIKLVWSTSDSPTYKNNCLSLGASAYFVKPSNLSALQDVVRQMLAFI